MQVSSSPLALAAKFLTSHNATAIEQQQQNAKKNAVVTKDYQDELMDRAKNQNDGGARGSKLDVTV